MTLRCSEIDELLAPLALDALEPDDRLSVLEHIADCRQHDAELDDFRQAVALLPTALNPIVPPVGLQESLLEKFRDQKNRPTALIERNPAAAPVTKPWRRLSFAYGIAAAMMLLAAGLGAWALSSNVSQEQENVIVRLLDKGDMHLDLVYLQEEELAVMDLKMPALPPDRAYQAWQITDLGPESLGVMPPVTTQLIRADLSRATALAITVEPQGGSTAPTTTPILVASLK